MGVITNAIISKNVSEALKEKEERVIQKFIENEKEEFPSSDRMSLVARQIEEMVYDHSEKQITDPDQKLISWTAEEYHLFRAFEAARYMPKISQGFSDVTSFVGLANKVLNRRKSRAGKSLEHHLAALFDANQLLYTPQAKTEGNKKPDFIFPSESAYHNKQFPTDKLISLAAKTTCKDRWRQILNESDRLRSRTKYLCTLQQGISSAQLREMQAEQVVLVVPKMYINTYPEPERKNIWTIAMFIQHVKSQEAQMQTWI